MFEDTKVDLERAERRLSELKLELFRLDREYGLQAARTRGLLSSHSWRITAPLRSVKAWLSGRRAAAVGFDEKKDGRVGPARDPATIQASSKPTVETGVVQKPKPAPEKADPVIHRALPEPVNKQAGPPREPEPNPGASAKQADRQANPAREPKPNPGASSKRADGQASPVREPRAASEEAASTTPDVSAGAMNGQTRPPSESGSAPEKLRQQIRHSADLDGLQKIALAERCLAARDLITRIASDGECDYGRLREKVMINGRIDPDALARTCIHPRATRTLARVVANLDLEPDSKAFAAALYQRYLRDASIEAMLPYDHVLFIDLLDANGQVDAASRHLEKSGLALSSPSDTLCLRANLLHPVRHGGDVDTWLATINELFTGSGLEPIALEPSGLPYLDRLTCTAGEAHVDQPLVSVLMTAYRPDAATDRAIASVLAQTWRNLELIIVDDRSFEQDYARLLAWPAKDARVRVLRTERNGGTYAAKNLGLTHAKGELVTCHDSDDWSHPRKIESQAVHLLSSGDRIGNLSAWVRVSEDVRFERFTNQGTLAYTNASSLMFRREPVVSRIGCWDNARTGADTEYHNRIELAFGRKLEVISGPPLSFGRVHQQSLTSGSVGKGYLSFERRTYQAAWRYWHREISEQGASPMLQAGIERPFPAPASLLPDRDTLKQGDARFDIVLVADFSVEQDAPHLAKRIEAHLKQGLSAAICQVRSFQEGALGQRFNRPRIQRFVNKRKVRQVDLEDEVSCYRLLVLTPSFLEHASCLESRICAEKLEIISPTSRKQDESGHPVPNREVTSQVAMRLFGSRLSQPSDLKFKEPAAKSGTTSRPTTVRSDGVTKAASTATGYWEQRKDELYYHIVRVLSDKLSVGAKSVIDIGSNKCPYLEWFLHVPLRTSIDLRRPYEAPGVKSLKHDFLTWEPDRKYDLALCLQVLEHVPDAGAFAQKLLEVAKIVVVSVPYRWEVGKNKKYPTKGHVHDPVDEHKLIGWFGCRPNYEYVCPDVVTGLSRLIQVYERNGDQWDSISQRNKLRKKAKERSNSPSPRIASP